ncbi:hypothetical protein OXX59_006718 [Metschnikowia pulcherrima]
MLKLVFSSLAYVAVLHARSVVSVVLPPDHANGHAAPLVREADLNGHAASAEIQMVTVKFPDFIKETPCPDWLSSWEDAEFGTFGGMFPDLYLGPSSNVTIQRAYALASMTGGTWLSEEKLAERGDLEDVDSIVLRYAETGDERYLGPISPRFGSEDTQIDSFNERAYD